jgi:putative endonuclease
MISRSQIGSWGEDIATTYLRQNGYFICNRNWRQGRYEIDIIAEKAGVIHFVEVKTRRAGSLIKPEETITPTKAAAMRKAAAAYLAQHPTNIEIEFDLLAIDLFPDQSHDIRFVANVVEFGW